MPNDFTRNPRGGSTGATRPRDLTKAPAELTGQKPGRPEPNPKSIPAGGQNVLNDATPSNGVGAGSLAGGGKSHR